MCALHLTLVSALALLPADPAAAAAPGGPDGGSPEAPLRFAFGDHDGDGRLDLYAANPQGPDRLLANRGDAFFDVTRELGLAGRGHTRSASWTDWDADDRLDLLLVGTDGRAALLRNTEQAGFVDVTEASRLASEDAVLAATWLDYDGDGLADLALRTDRGDRLFHNAGGGAFEPAALPLGAVDAPRAVGGTTFTPLGASPRGTGDAGGEQQASDDAAVETGVKVTPGKGTVTPVPMTPPGPTPTPDKGPGRTAYPGPTAAVPMARPSERLEPLLGGGCASSLADAASAGACLQASSVPTKGALLPLGPLFYVDPAGNVGIGTETPQTRLDVDGSTTTRTLTITGGSDLAEPFELSGGELEPGTVVCIDADAPGRLRASTRAYDTTVVGVVSGAGGVRPGLTLSQAGRLDRGQPVALSGRVYVRCDAAHGAIRPGDLLTTSPTPGRAMRAGEPARAAGAVLGKAMTSLDEGHGLVLAVVALQ